MYSIDIASEGWPPSFAPENQGETFVFFQFIFTDIISDVQSTSVEEKKRWLRIPELDVKKQKLESCNHGKNFIQVTISTPAALHKIEEEKKNTNKQAWNSFKSSFSLSILIIIPKGLMRKPDLYLIRTTVNQILGAMLQVKLAPKRLGEAKREVDLINPTFPIISSYSRKTFICSVLFLRESYFKIICFMKKLYLYSSNAITRSEINATWGMGGTTCCIRTALEGFWYLALFRQITLFPFLTYPLKWAFHT